MKSIRFIAIATFWIAAPGWAGISYKLQQSAPSTPEAQTSSPKQNSEQDGAKKLPTGKKLVLKDGNYQLVRSYERNGDRVRYLSAERGEWEEIPAEMVDWAATAKAEAADAESSNALVKKVHAQEEANKAEIALDVDISLMLAPGVFLPPGEGMFAVEGKSITPLEQVGSRISTDKKQLFKQIMSPIPIVSSKQNVEIPGAQAKVRINSTSPEFYLREAPPDPDRVSPVQKSSRPGESGPEVELVRATVKGNKRRLESIKSLFGQEMGTERNTLSMQRWEVAPFVYRFTLGEPLPPGEYALAEMLPDVMNLFVWDFGVDGAVPEKIKAHEKNSSQK